MKKFISLFTLLFLLSSSFYFTANAVPTNGLSSPWTMEKAEHLTKRALYGATKEKVLELYNAGSSTAAVNILFPSVAGPDRTAYDAKMALLLDPQYLIGYNNSQMREFYTVKRFDDPYEAKAKLMGLFEDTLSVSTRYNRITYQDVEATHDLIYSHTLGNYKEMIKRMLYNNGVRGDYSLGDYLDLFNQRNPQRPNENYSRELLQLFLMGDYLPTESQDTGGIRNYSESEDVQALARILYGLEKDEATHMISYNGTGNTNTDIEFLDGPLKIGDSFPFYNTGSGILNIQDMQVSIAGNNGLMDNIIDYIFSKRENEIGLFMANKLYTYYVGGEPTMSDLELLKNELLANNFELFPTVKRLLADDMMYSDKSMNSVVYKNPLELIIGTSKTLGLSSDVLDLRYALTKLLWTPHGAGTIFGREGFDTNGNFYTPYVAIKWSREASILSTKLIDNNLGFFNTGVTTATGVIADLEDKLYFGKSLDPITKAKLATYLTTDKDGNQVSVDFSDPQYVARNIQGALYIMLTQPEHILQSGYDSISGGVDTNGTFYDNKDSKLILMKASGGLDWLHAFIQKDQYPEYIELRGTGALTGTGVMDLDQDYYMNSSLAPFKSLFDEGNLRLINRVGTAFPSRSHDAASRKNTSLNNKYGNDDGIFGYFIGKEAFEKTVVLRGGTNPLILRSGNYMGIGSEAIYLQSSGNVSISTDERNYKINTLQDILLNRNYSGEFGDVFKNSVLIDQVARESKANGGRDGSGWNMTDNYTFLESLYDVGLGNTTWMLADGGYDTHSNQKERLNSNFEKVSRSTADFFNRVKDRHDVTIVIYTEFGRTNRLNSSDGVDHGNSSGIFIISNNTKLLNEELPEKIYGNIDIKDSRSNWLGVGIDYRSVYKAIFKGLYDRDISAELGGEYDINKYVDKTAPDINFHNIYFSNGSSSRNKVNLRFEINDPNFKVKEGSYIKYEYGTDPNNMYEVSDWYIGRYTTVTDKYVNVHINNTTPGIKYYYKVTFVDNQHNTKIVEGDFISPVRTNTNVLEKGKPTILTQYFNTTVSGSLDLTSITSSGIILSNSGTVVYGDTPDLRVLASSGTYIQELTSSSGSINWNGSFIAPKLIDANDFIALNSEFNSGTLLGTQIVKLFQVGSDVLGVGMKLNKGVDIEVANIDATKQYIILSSEDGINWIKNNETYTIVGNKLTFTTEHFTFFAVVESDGNGNPSTVESNTTANITTSGGGGGGGASRFTKDNCPYGDYSISYYDKTCGIDPESLEMNHSSISDNSSQGFNPLMNNWNIKTPKEMKKAYEELVFQESDKARVFEELFMEELINEDSLYNQGLGDVLDSLNDSKREILFLLRENLSSIIVGGNKVTYIKGSDLNPVFEKIAILLVKKNFSEEKTNDLFENLNKVIMHYAINELDGIKKEVKTKNIILLKKSVKDLVKLYKSNNKVVKINKVKKEIKQVNVEDKREESVREKIIRLNKERLNSNNNMEE